MRWGECIQAVSRGNRYTSTINPKQSHKVMTLFRVYGLFKCWVFVCGRLSLAVALSLSRPRSISLSLSHTLSLSRARANVSSGCGRASDM